MAADNADETWWHIIENKAITVYFGKWIQIAIVENSTLSKLDFWSFLLGVVALRLHAVLDVGDKLYTFYETRQLNFFIAFTVIRAAPVLKPLDRDECIQTICEQPCDDDNIFVLLVHKDLSFFISTLLMHPVQDLAGLCDIPGNLKVWNDVVHVSVTVIYFGLKVV